MFKYNVKINSILNMTNGKFNCEHG
ncbi:unnamed protein product, partial [Rotaria magnacalcarata]